MGTRWVHHPRVLLNVWLYGFMTGIRSSRKLGVAALYARLMMVAS